MIHISIVMAIQKANDRTFFMVLPMICLGIHACWGKCLGFRNKKHLFLTDWQVAFQVQIPKPEPPCLCSATPTTQRLIQQARSPCQWAHRCTWESLWMREIQALQLFWRTATPLTHETLTILCDTLSSRTSMCPSGDALWSILKMG